MEDLDIDSLPDDPAQLKQLIVSQVMTLKQNDLELRYLREQVNLLLHKRFAASSEKHPGQHELFDEVEHVLEEASDTTEEAITDETVTIAEHARKKPGRKPLPADLPRVEVIHDLPEDEKVCAEDGHPLHRIGEDISEQLEIIPAKVQVIRNIRYKYGCRQCEMGVKTAPLPEQVIPKSIATPGLLAYVAIGKYADALPLYRQSKIFQRLGVELNRTTLANWMIRVGELIQPLIALMQAELKKSHVLQMDETPVQVLKEPDRPASSQSYMWVMLSGAYDPAIVVYDYVPSRASAVPMRSLEGYQGYLVSDGYKGYNAITDQPEVTGIGCWAHARRKFDEALKVQGKSKKIGKAQFALNEIGKLYAIERGIETKRSDEKRLIRQARAGPILIKFRTWLDKSLGQVPPATVLGKALKYLDNEWDRLNRYIEDGELPMDNNRCENAIRPFVVGRKNWLFSNSQAGAHASAAIYSMVESAKHNGLEPYSYLRHVLTELPKKQDDLSRLLPYNLKAETIDC